jgi:Protein of unknown function (DUF1579)
MSPWPMRGLPVWLVLGWCAIFAPSARAQVNNVQAIGEHMRSLRPLIGEWRVLVTFYDRQGGRRYGEGRYHIHSVLDGAYIEIEAHLRSKDRPERHNSFLQFITYDPRRAKFVVAYLYSQSSLQVTEEGDYDEAKQELQTITFIPKEDGKRDENVHTITRLADPGQIEYLHYSRYSDEAAERMDSSVTLVRD